jgi:glycopeptide antibiotics resistance protein
MKNTIYIILLTLIMLFVGLRVIGMTSEQTSCPDDDPYANCALTPENIPLRYGLLGLDAVLYITGVTLIVKKVRS